eukprot:TRINITY_DN20558_c0_g1_i1.p1 TRINITY_DN20558_c0_g1~~TRINITY_DN20558_c0_g1_i1.p1  ORF type:complete len:375 (-),score=98.64 TRINITY_DN20558_c0_g1_i1:380-1504(-)
MELWGGYSEAQHRLPEETLCCANPDVTIYIGKDKTRHRHGKLSLTSHRIIWESRGTAIQLPLSFVSHTETKSGGLFGTAKLKLHLANPDQPYMMLGFDSGRDTMLHQLNVVLKMQSWSEPVLGGAHAEQNIPAFGLAGLDRAAKVRAERQSVLTQDAFTDLDSLVQLAKPMVELANRLQGKLSQQGSTELTPDQLELAELLETAGIHNPVTKSSTSKSEFHVALARELGAAMKGPLNAAKGMLLLHDVYCIHSRMRGTQLVSPQDLLRAAELLEQLGTGMTVHKFGSGVLVLRSVSRDDESICTELHQFMTGRERGWVTVLDVAQELDLSVLLAEEYIRICEARGLLCKDQSVEASRFFVNQFCPITTCLTTTS